jgi:aminoglycoside phosphotransferase family enzyme
VPSLVTSEPVDPGEDSQRRVIEFLQDPATHGGEPVTRVDTHILRVFLSGPRAGKLKRAIRTNYLDFSTLEKRERICRREIEVNANPAAHQHRELCLGPVRIGGQP